MPDDFAALLEKHIAIDELLSAGTPKSDQIAVAVSALLPSISDERWTECAQFDSVYSRVRPVNGPNVQELLNHIDQEFIEFAPVLKLNAPAKTLAAWYEESLVTAAT